jgi:hypothetical protein
LPFLHRPATIAYRARSAPIAHRARVSRIAHRVCSIAVLVVLAPPVACAQQAKVPPQAPAPPGAALAPFAAQRVIVVPVQLFRADTAAHADAARWEAFRRELDDSIGTTIAGRGVGKTWSYAADVVRSAKRNAAYVSDPYALGVQPLRNAVYKPGEKIPQLLAANLRSLIALGDTRYALIPVEIALVRRGNEQRAILRLILVDGRAGEFLWVGDVISDPATSLDRTVVSSLSARVADLVVAP